jgi:hypothetical protein
MVCRGSGNSPEMETACAPAQNQPAWRCPHWVHSEAGLMAGDYKHSHSTFKAQLLLVKCSFNSIGNYG